MWEFIAVLKPLLKVVSCLIICKFGLKYGWARVYRKFWGDVYGGQKSMWSYPLFNWFYLKLPHPSNYPQTS